MSNGKLVLVLLPLALGLVVGRLIPYAAALLSLIAWVFLALWGAFGYWIFRSGVRAAPALAAGVGTPFLFLILYLATAGTMASVFPQHYLAPVAPAAAQIARLIGGTALVTVQRIYVVSAVLLAAAFLAGYLYGRFTARQGVPRHPSA